MAGAGPVTFLATILPLILPSAVRAGIAGPYSLTMRDLGDCPSSEVREAFGDDLVIAGKFHYSRNVKGTVFSGNATVKNNVFVRDATVVVFDCARWDPVSGWRDHFLVMPLGEFCFVMEEVAVDIVVLLRKFIPSFPKKCPLSDGFYKAEGVTTGLGQLGHFPVLPYGRFRVHAFFYNRKNMKPRSCLRAIVDVVAKLKTTP